MSKYFDPATRGFYTADVHGARQIEVVDPAWTRPTIEVEILPGESAVIAGELVVNDSDETISRFAPDTGVQAPMIVINNPDCRIPPAAVEISDALYRELLDGEQAGQVIAVGQNGHPVLVDRPAPTEAAVEAAVTATLQGRIDDVAKAWGYDNIHTAVGYIDDPYPPFAAEALVLRQYRSDVWQWAIAKRAAIAAGDTPRPQSIEAFLADMPAAPARPGV